MPKLLEPAPGQVRASSWSDESEKFPGYKHNSVVNACYGVYAPAIDASANILL